MDNEQTLNQGIQVAATQVPLTPTNLAVNNQTQTTVTLSWDEALEAEGYRIYRSDTATGTFTQVGETTNLTYVDQNLTPNTTYYYTVSAYNELGESAQTTPVEATTLQLVPPTNLVVTPINNNTLSLSYTPSGDYDNFTIYRSEDETGPFNQIAITNLTTYVDDGLEPNTTYYYRIVTNLNGQTSETYVSGNATTTDTPVVPTIVPPNRVVAIKVNCNTIELRWNLVNGATRYNIYRSTNVNGPFQLVNTSYGFNYFDNTLDNGTTYYYYITSANVTEESNPSTIVTNTTYQNCNNSCYDRVCKIVIRNCNVYKCCFNRQRRCSCCNED